MNPEHHAETRLPADAIPEITGLRFLPQQTPADLLNISSSGLLAESSGRLTVGQTAEMQFEGGFAPGIVTGRVARCEVAAMRADGTLRYQIAIEFDVPLALGAGTGGTHADPHAGKASNRW